MGISLKQLFPQFNPETEQISEPDFRNQSKINSLFQLFVEDNTALKLKIQGGNDSFSTCVIDVDTKTSLFTIDELHPVEGHRLLISTGTFIAHALIKGVSVSFHTSLIRTDKQGQFFRYVCDIPDSISYIQRRREYRVKVHPTLSFPVSAQHKSSTQLLQGQIHDISMSGVAIEFKEHYGTRLKPGDELTNCKLSLPKDESIGVTLEVRHVQSSRAGKIRVGGLYRNLNTRSEDIICRFVREMERVSLKK